MSPIYVKHVDPTGELLREEQETENYQHSTNSASTSSKPPSFLKLFKRVEDDNGCASYEFTMPHPNKEEMLSEMLAAGISFAGQEKMFTKFVQLYGHKDELGRPKITRSKASEYAQAFCLLSLWFLALLMRNS
eukprot:GHVU01001725.1.p1 GENE.GHVU01001725.1~~GHVU01001725.1.p1  ORF type:complete len:133 (-),score=11.64 GHVU01001725.1:105-503(-)